MRLFPGFTATHPSYACSIRKRAAKPVFEVAKSAIGGGYVRATLTDGTIDRIEGFASEGEAGRWIKNESVVWLNERDK